MMRNLYGVVSILIVAAAGPAAAGGLAASPPSIDLGTIHASDVKTFTFRLTNGGAKPAKNVACRGANLTFAPARLTLAPGASAAVVATYTEKKTLRLIGRLDAAITCGAAKLSIAGVRDETPRVDPRPTSAAALAHAVTETTGWGGMAYSPPLHLVNIESCGSPMQGDPDACCVLSLADLAGTAKTSYVLAGDDCSRAGARAPADVATELATKFQQGGWIALEVEAWIGGARLLPDGRLLESRDGGIWLGDQHLADVGGEVTRIAFTPDLRTVLISGDRWVPVTLP